MEMFSLLSINNETAQQSFPVIHKVGNVGIFTVPNVVAQGYVFIGIRDSVHTGGGWCGRHPPGRHTPLLGTHTLPWADPPEMATAADGTYLTGMHSCRII